MKRFTKLSTVSFILGLLFSVNAIAQDEVTDEELRRYALLQEVIDVMKKEISVEVNELIKAQEGIDGKRYLELAKAKGDESKLQELEAKEFELKFLEVVDNLKEERTESIKTVNQELATKMLGDGGKVYKKVKSAISSDDAVKARYEEILASIKMDSES